MTEQEQMNTSLQRQIDSQNARLDKALSNFDTKFNMMMEEIRQQREDMRRLQDRQDEDRRKHDAEMHEMNERFYNKIDENFKTLSNQIHNLTIAAVVGFGAIALAVGGLGVVAFK